MSENNLQQIQESTRGIAAKLRQGWHNRWDPEARTEIAPRGPLTRREKMLASIAVVGVLAAAGFTTHLVLEASKADSADKAPPIEVPATVNNESTIPNPLKVGVPLAVELTVAYGAIGWIIREHSDHDEQSGS